MKDQTSAKKNQDFYQQLRKRVVRWSETEEGKSYQWTRWILMAPDLFHLLVKLTLDSRISVYDKAKLAAATAYFIAPLDFLPELILGPMGYADDIVIAATVLNQLVNSTPEEIIQEHWAGEGDVLKKVQAIIYMADEMIGSGLFKKIRKVIDR